MDQPPSVGYPHQPQQQGPQQMMNGPMMRSGPGPMSGPMNNFPSHGPPGMANPGMGIPIGQMPGNAMSPGMGGPRAPNMGVSYSPSFYPCIFKILLSSNYNIIKACTLSSQRPWRACQEVVRALPPPANSILAKANPSLVARRTTVSYKVKQWV